MRFLYATAILAALTASAQAYSTGSPVCKSDDATLQSVAAAGKMGKQVDTNTFDNTWGFTLWDENSKPVTGNSIMTNMQYSVTVKGGAYNGVMTYPMFDDKRIPVASESKSFSLEPGSDSFQVAAKCAGKDGLTITHSSGDSKDAKAVVAKFTLMDAGSSKKFMMSGIVVTAKNTFGKAVTPSYDIAQGTGGNNNTDGGNNNTDGGNTDDGNTGNTEGGNTAGGNTDSGNNGTDPTGTNSASFVRPAIALQLIALAAFLLA